MKLKLAFLLLFAIICGQVYSQDTIAIDSTVKFQTIVGWGDGGGILGPLDGAYSMLDPNIANPVNYEILDYLIDDLGLTGSRTTEVGPRTDGTGMDNGNCDSIDWSRFDSFSLPIGEANYLMYFNNRILAEGYQPSFYSSTGYPTNATLSKHWVMNDPGERAQQIWANAYFMKDAYGININYDVIYNEPSGAITPSLISDDIKALAPRLVSRGLNTKTQYAEAVAPETDWGFITPVEGDTALWPLIGRLSYHNYGTADPYRSYIYNFGLTKGLTTAQTEMGNPTFDDLYSDLTLANVSYWEVAYSGSNTVVPASGLTAFTPSATFFRLRQVLHYVRPGSVRINTTTNDSLLHILAFVNNGKQTTIVDNTSSTIKTVHLTGVPAGTYGLSQSISGATGYQEFGLRAVGATDTLDLNVNPGGTVTTLYPYNGPNNAPDIMTWVANPGYLVLPASTATISATASDAELNSLTYQWTVFSEPAGANAVIAAPNAATSSVSGLTVAGTYIFNINVSDGVNISSKKLYLISYSSNPPPVLGSAGFRFAAPYGLVFDNPGVATHANIELPTSSGTLQIGISDLANSDFTGRGKWSLVQQPAGANITLDTTSYIYVSIRANVSGMTVPGDYIFQVNVTNPGQPDLTAQIICTVHPATLPPVISSITSYPTDLTLPASTAELSAVTSDPQGDLLRYWWVATAAPAGATPVFDHQGLAVTDVSGLTVVGTYIFTLRCFNDIHMTVANDTIHVDSCICLPLTLENFQGAIVDQFAALSWTTFDEVNAAYDVVERSYDGINFSFVSSLPAKGSAKQNNYQFTDEPSFANSKVFYRLKFVSKNGKYTYSNILEFPLGEGTAVGVHLFPNPAKNYVQLTYSSVKEETTTIKISDISGKTIISQLCITNKGVNSVEVDLLSRLPAGTYFIQLVINGKNVVNKLVVE